LAIGEYYICIYKTFTYYLAIIKKNIFSKINSFLKFLLQSPFDDMLISVPIMKGKKKDFFILLPDECKYS
jgi:hypothetical protein